MVYAKALCVSAVKHTVSRPPSPHCLLPLPTAYCHRQLPTDLPFVSSAYNSPAFDKKHDTMHRINIGCGQTPTAGWRNFDNSFSLRLATRPVLATLLNKLGLLQTAQQRFIAFARANRIEYGDATRRLPLAPDSCEVIYCSHMLEHLDRAGASRFLKESYRVLAPNGIVRIVVPDINRMARHYLDDGDADAFLEATHLCVPRPSALIQKIKFLAIGTRHHQWMYDGGSLSRLLRRHGFTEIEVMPAGKTRIPEPGALDLEERGAASVCVEASKPSCRSSASHSPAID